MDTRADFVQEYDNDDPASGLGFRTAGESVIIRGAIAPPPPSERSAEGTKRSNDVHDESGPETGGEADVAEINLGSWDLPESFIVRPSPAAAAPHAVKPALAALDRRALRKGRTVSFHGFPTDDPVEELGEEPLAQSEEPRERPRSSASIMARGRPTSPFRAEEPSIDVPPRNDPSSSSPHTVPDDVNPFTIPPPAGPRLSRFDPKATPTDGTRPQSTTRGSFPAPNAPPSPARIRPRTLIMPTPLHGTHDPHVSAPPSRWDTESFTHGAKPLPPGALTRPDSFVARMNRGDVFRMTLDRPAGREAGAGLPSAMVEGEIAVRQVGGDDEESEEEAWDPDDWRPETRSVGGWSLMDRLEARKRELKGKNRCAFPRRLRDV